jgi:hypothetical protein
MASTVFTPGTTITSPWLNDVNFKTYNDNALSVAYTPADTGAVQTTVQAKLRQSVSVKDFGATGDGTTNDTAAIQLADSYARSIGSVLIFPAGTYMVSQLVLYTNSNWQGQGRDATIIKSIAGSNTDLIYGYNSNANWGSTTPVNFPNGFAIRYMTLDGNRANNSTGSGIAAFASRPILENLFIKNCAEHGLRTEYYDSSNGGLDTFAMEGWFSNVRVDTVGKHGWLNNGPHDSASINFLVIDASQSTANTYDGFYCDARSSTRNIASHAWTRSTSVRANSALNIRPGATHEFSGGCNFEGGYNANVIIASQNCLFDPSTRYYAAWNGVNILMTSTANLCTIMGKLDAPGAGRPACYGIQIGQTAGDYISNNIIDVNCASQEAGNIYFNANYSGTTNRIKALCYNTTSATISGLPKTTDDVDLMFLNSAGTSHINNRDQKTTLSIGANASAVWTFPYAFAANPIVTFSPASPSAAITSGMWISALGTTSVTFFNNNAVTATLHIVAKATN